MIRIILFYGIAGALVVAAFMVAGSLGWAEDGHMPSDSGLIVGYLTQLVALTTVFLGIKTYRDKSLGGVVKFLPAFGVGLAISAIASLGWVAAWEIVLAMTGLDFGEMMVRMTVEQKTASGATEAEIQKAAADAKAFGELYMSNLFVRVPMTFVEMFPVGVLVSLISALLLRNSRFLPARAAA